MLTTTSTLEWLTGQGLKDAILPKDKELKTLVLTVLARGEQFILDQTRDRERINEIVLAKQKECDHANAHPGDRGVSCPDCGCFIYGTVEPNLPPGSIVHCGNCDASPVMVQKATCLQCMACGRTSPGKVELPAGMHAYCKSNCATPMKPTTGGYFKCSCEDTRTREFR